MAERAAIQTPCPWHRVELERFDRQVADGRMPHAVLLSGPPGIGKWRLARAMLERLLCQSPRGGLACGECHACHMAVAGTHPDLFVLEPESAGKAIKVDDVRDLVAFCSRTAAGQGARIAFISPAEAMNRNAANALLKTLEEPGENTLLLLVSHQPGLLLPTVRSRCQQRPFSAPSAGEASEWMVQQGIDGDEAAGLLAVAGGAPLRASELRDTDWFASRARLVGNLLNLLDGRQSVAVVARAFSVHDTGSMIQALQGWVRQALRIQSGVGARVPDPVLQRPLEQLAQQAGSERLLRLDAALDRARRSLSSGSNPNPELLFEELMLVIAPGDIAVDLTRYRF